MILTEKSVSTFRDHGRASGPRTLPGTRLTRPGDASIKNRRHMGTGA
jgi:hypothetical protein